MPAAFVKSLAKDAGIDFAEAEKRWKKAKSIAEQQTGMTEGDGDDYWKYVAGVFKKSMGIVTESATAKEIHNAAHEAATSHKNDLPQPTQAQIEANNYKKGHISLYGLGITIENPKGSARRGIDPNGKPWETILPAHYGYVKRTEGADGDHVDVYIGEHPESERVFVVDQQDLFKGGFDEHKVVLACQDSEDARNVYCGGFSDGKGADRIGAITEISLDVFKEWLKTEKTLKPMSAVLESADYDWKAALESATSFSDIRIVFERSFPAVIKPIPKIGEDGYKLWFETKEEAIETMAAMQAEGIKADHVAEAYKDGRFMFKIYRSREEIDRINAEFKAASEKRAAEEKVRTEKARAEFEDVQGFDAGMASLQRGKILAALNKQVSWNGVIESRKKQVEQQVSEGYYVENHPKWGRLLKDPKDDSFWEEKTIGKTAMDYAIYLIGKNAA